MASIRSRLLDELVARLRGITGWDAQLRGHENNSEADVRAIVFHFTEDDELARASPAKYAATLHAGVSIIAAADKADPVLDLDPVTAQVNPYRFLDRLVVLAHKAIHAAPDWVTPGLTDFSVTGHEVELPSNANEVEATLRLTFTYRHAYADPEAA
jgi:hypothetical protein